ncbi:MAG TPA: glycosyltransferase [Mucilaginibacter sp.]|nr:glycosyltransferase [Mucilaginibacter sp.]
MKVCHICFSFIIGGIENLLIDILNEQSTKAEIYLLIINNVYDEVLLNRISNKVHIVLIKRPQGSKWSFAHLVKLWIFLFKTNPAIIHCHTPNLISILAPFKRKCIYTVHNMGIAVKNLGKYKKLFAISKAVQMDLLKRGQLESEVIYNGIDFSRFETKKNYKLGAGKRLKLVQISRLLHEQKGQDLLIRSIHKLVNEYQLNNIFVDIIGDGPSQEYLERITDELGLVDYINFVGPKDRSWIYANLCEFDALVQPSRYEGFGLTVIEAVAAGLPVIASNVDGPAEILTNVPSAYFFESENIDELAGQIKKVLTNFNENKIEADCKRAVTEVKNKFSVITTANNYLTYYGHCF